MARYASLTLNFSAYVSTGCYLELTLLGTPVRFYANEGSGATVFRTFAQNPNPEIVDGGSPQMEANVSALVSALRDYLQYIGETRYEVTGEMTRNDLGFPQGGRVVIRAREYDPALNLSYSVYNVPGGSGLYPATLTNDPPGTVTLTTSTVVCFGGATGSATVEVTGGYPPYTFLWSDGSTQQNRSMLPAGNYTLTVRDTPDLSVPGNAPMEVTQSVQIGQNPQILVGGTVSGDSISVEVSGGVGPYTFLWSDGSTQQNRVGLAAGDYGLVVTDSVGCQRAASFRITPDRFYFSKNPIPLTLSAGEPGSKPNLTFLCEVWVEREYLSGEFEQVVTLEHPADAVGQTTFDVSEFLDVYLRPHLPEWGRTVPHRAEGVVLRYLLKYSEKYGTPPVAAPFTTTDIRYVVKGGLSWEESARGTFFSSYRPAVKNFFTWSPQRKEVRPEQPEYLYFMPDSFSLTSFRVRVKAFFEDGTSLTYDHHAQEGLRRFELWCIPCGHNQLNLAALREGARVLRYKVWVADSSGGFLSEVRHFVVRREHQPNLRFLLFANSLGGTDTLVARGHATHRLAVSSETVERTPELGHDPLDGDSYVAGKTGSPVLLLSLGNLSHAERLALQDVRLTEQAVLLSEDRYLAGELVMKSDEVLDEFDGLKAVEAEFRLPSTSRYTPALRLEGYAPLTPDLD